MTYFRYKIDVKKSNSLSVYQQDTIYMDTILKEIKLIKKKKKQLPRIKANNHMKKPENYKSLPKDIKYNLIIQSDTLYFYMERWKMLKCPSSIK